MENNQNNENIVEQKEAVEESTIFSAPGEHTDKKKKSKYSLIKKVIAGLLIVAVLVGGTFAVIHFIPEKTPEQVEMNNGTVIFSAPIEEFKKITITHSKGSYTLLSETENKEQVWTLEGYDNSLIDKESLAQIVSYAASLTSFGEYEDSKDVDYGFSSPRITVKVEGEKDSYTIYVGNDTADGSYSYIKLSTNEEKIYLGRAGTYKGFIFEPLELAISTAIPAVEKTDATAEYFDDSGLLNSFDTLTISGTRFKKTLTFKPNKDGQFSDFATYICTTPLLRVANDVEDVRDIFRNGVASASAVSFDQSAESLKKFGLDNPEWIITLKIKNQSYTYRITPTDKTNTEYYVASTTDKMIRTVMVSNLIFIEKEEKDFYFGFMALESINDVKEFKLSGEVNTSFLISYDEDNDIYNVTNGGKEVKSQDFPNFYAEFIQTTAIDFSTVSTSAKPSLTMTIKHHGEQADTVLTFTKISESRYQYTVGSNAMGQIPSSSYDRLLKQIKKLIP